MTGARGSLILVGVQASRAEVSPGIDPDGKVITIGAFTPVTGPVQFYTLLTEGVDAYFKWLNDNGGIRGWTIDYITIDDGYQPARSVATARRLVESDNIFALVGSIATPTNVAVLPYAKEHGLPVIPIGGASLFYASANVFPLVPDFGLEAAANAAYAMDSLGAKTVALLWQNDELGRTAKRGVDAYMKSRGAALAVDVPIEVKSTDFSAHIQRLKDAGAEAVIIFESNANLASALKAAKRVGFEADWFAPFFAADPSTYALAGDSLHGTYFSSWLLPVTSDDPQVTLYREAMAKYYPNHKAGVFGLNGFGHAVLFQRGFEALLDSGDELTRDNFIKAMNTLRDVQVGGAKNVTFTPDDHRGVRQENIIRAANGSFEEVRGFAPFPKAVFDASKPEKLE